MHYGAMRRYMNRMRENPGPGECAHCGKPATCYGVYEDNAKPIERACDGCCGHGNEDGWCEPIVPTED